MKDDKRVNLIINECSYITQKEVWLSGESDPLEIMQGNELWSYYQMLYAQTRLPCK